MQPNTYNNYKSNYNWSDDRISRSNLFAIVLEESLLQMQRLTTALRKRQSIEKTKESMDLNQSGRKNKLTNLASLSRRNTLTALEREY